LVSQVIHLKCLSALIFLINFDYLFYLKSTVIKINQIYT
jgi:hypothetical protein